MLPFRNRRDGSQTWLKYIAFDDGEGTTYEENHYRVRKPYVFGFGEVDDLVNISLPIRLTMLPWAVNTAAGWHQCLDVLVQIIKGKPIQWHDNSTELSEIYSEVFKMEASKPIK